jgi:hypothetical protein
MREFPVGAQHWRPDGTVSKEGCCPICLDVRIDTVVLKAPRRGGLKGKDGTWLANGSVGKPLRWLDDERQMLAVKFPTLIVCVPGKWLRL